MSRPRNLNDLIRIEDAIKVLCRRVCHPGMFCPDAYCTEMWELLEDVERVDAVPVVMCKDCKYYERSMGYCERLGITINDEDYCSFGERKDGKGNGNETD